MGDAATDSSTLRYLDILQRHASDFSSHLAGSLSGSERLEPSFFPPAGFWTVGEKDAFFHSLAVHSRLRPDLIAADLPGKSVADVCSYLELLAEAVTSAPKLKQSLTKPAYESTSEWVDAEETHARYLLSWDSQWEAEDRTRRRMRQLEAERRRITRFDGSRPKQSQLIYRAEQRRVEEVMKDVRAQRQLQWDREDFTSALDLQKLKTMDYISTESELTRHHSPVDMHKSNAGSSSSQKQPSHTGDEDLEGMSAEVDPRILSLSPASRRRYTKKMYMRRKRAERSGQSVSASIERLKGRDSTCAMPRPPSVTLLRQFASVGMDAAFFERTKLGILNFQALGELTQLYISTQERIDSEPTISLSTIELLHAELLCFLADIISKCISLHEQECSMKSGSVIWKNNNDKIKAATVQDALSMATYSGCDRQSFFTTLESRMDSFMAEENLGSVDPMEDSGESDSIGEECESYSDEEDGSGSDSLEGMDHESCRSLPSGIPSPFLWHSSLDHERPDPYTSVEGDGDADMNIATDDDEDVFRQALLHDEKIDEVDRLADKEAQIKMWEALAGKSQNEEDERSKKGFPGLRLLEPDAISGIKSSVYIDDSE